MNDLIADNKPISNKELRKIVLTLAIPVITEMILHTLMGVADTAMVGRLGAYAIASVSLVDTPVMLFIAFFSAVGAGATALVARYIGANNYADSQRTAYQAMFLSIIGSIILLIVGLIFAEKILLWLGTEPEVLPFAMKYFNVIILGLPFMSITIIMSGVLRGSGDTKTPMYVNGLSNIINIVGNFLMIFESRNIVLNIPVVNKSFNIFVPGAGMGVTGAAIATTFGRLIAALLILYVLFKKSGKYRLVFKKCIVYDVEILNKLAKIGLPAAAEQVTMRLGQIFFFRLVAQLGTVSLATHKVVITAESISFMPGWGFALAATTLVGQYLGANRPDIAKKAGHTANMMSVAIMSIMGVFFFILPEIFIKIFSNDPEIISLGTTCLRIVAFSQPFLSMAMVYAGGLRGAGDTKTVMYTTLIGIWFLRVGISYYLLNFVGMGLNGAWICMFIDFGIRGILLFILFNRGKWAKIKI